MYECSMHNIYVRTRTKFRAENENAGSKASVFFAANSRDPGPQTLVALNRRIRLAAAAALAQKHTKSSRLLPGIE